MKKLTNEEIARVFSIYFPNVKVITPDGVATLVGLPMSIMQYDRVSVHFGKIVHTKNSIDGGSNKQRNFGDYLINAVRCEPIGSVGKTDDGFDMPGGVKLLLTPLSEITDEHAIEVAKMATHLHENNAWELIKIVREKEMVKVYFKDLWNKHDAYDYFVKVAPYPLQGVFKSYKGEILEQNHYQFPLGAYDKLRDLGYALPYKNKDLFELNIAINPQLTTNG